MSLEILNHRPFVHWGEIIKFVGPIVFRVANRAIFDFNFSTIEISHQLIVKVIDGGFDVAVQFVVAINLFVLFVAIFHVTDGLRQFVSLFHFVFPLFLNGGFLCRCGNPEPAHLF